MRNRLPAGNFTGQAGQVKTFEKAQPIWPGIALAMGASVLATGVNAVVPAASALLLAIIAGIVLGNATQVVDAPAVAPGLAVASKRLLRLGIVLLGFNLSLSEVVALGPGGLLLVVTVVLVGYGTAQVVGRWLGIRRSARTLIGAGVSVCGAAAVAGVEGVVRDRRDEEVVTALALVVVFGTLMIPLLPALASLAGFGPEQAGLWIGASTHEVAQVVAGAGIIGADALAVAVVVKLARVVMLAPMVALLSWDTRRAMKRNPNPELVDVPAGKSRDEDVAPASTTRAKMPPLVPLFVMGFLAAAAIRTTGVLPTAILDVASFLQTVLLAAAMFALGCGIRVATLREVGGRPVALAAVVTTAVAAVGFAGSMLLG